MASGEGSSAAMRAFGADFAEADCLMLAEVATVLKQQADAHEEALRAGTTSEGLKDTFLKTLEYAQRFNHITEMQSIMDTRTMLEQAGLEPVQLAAMANLMPRSVAEARSLIPSLTERACSDDVLEGLINRLQELQRM
ncbi:uncharacterized protein AMSG_06966 [Thecamonas trahens ATCC 50062]|uniref:RNA polymerase Rpb4/RPC9 core domain-containing protein n=1 Tax=Thecamonas trahens ATCC 50062 TaxID=461836 RepID=A0A0L0DI62_THETB|nr:hypothetical protein AMSG_06966 [Thecamonas trahens ATCC 50062]KNC50993.1 hypothetical protein AMSG_06966 [Thecamonas trahens ATCC 50062]|eukprot:XP_013756462.1 hypothetical protein AMSG_06966 [Thecamonas trahens ATCC 50062]